jgi:hypothetical protein
MVDPREKGRAEEVAVSAAEPEKRQHVTPARRRECAIALP